MDKGNFPSNSENFVSSTMQINFLEEFASIFFFFYAPPYPLINSNLELNSSAPST